MRERKSASDNGTDALRITAQFRTRQGMAYELREHGARLTVLISANDDGADAAWRCEAFSSLAPANAIARTAPTRQEALQRTGAEWTVDARRRDLPAFDWDAVSRALAVVRAI
jgi:hypothetical protein